MTAGERCDGYSSPSSSDVGVLPFESGKPLGEAFTLFARIDEKKFLEEMEAKRLAALAAAAPIPEPEHEAEIEKMRTL